MIMRSLAPGLALALALAGCPSPSEPTDCTDGSDNDNDGLIDDADPGCAFNDGQLEAPHPSACQDGLDNDGDGSIDLADPGCDDAADPDETDPVTACSNGLDDDQDGLVDLGDPGCSSAGDTSEYNPMACGNGVDDDGDLRADYPLDPGCDSTEDNDEADPVVAPVCADGVDNDGDALTDYPADPGCLAASDPDEYNEGPCGPGVVTVDITATGEATGSATGPATNALVSAGCGGLGGEFVYTYSVTSSSDALVVSTDHPETTLDTVVYVRSECSEPDAELGCANDGGVAAGGRSSYLVLPSVAPGLYYIVVDRFGAGSDGAFKLTVEQRNGLHSTCDPTQPAPCVQGLVCREFTPGAGYTCEYHQCGDDHDNDGDGLVDEYDPGCASDDGDDETDPALLPQCGDGADNDGDALVDYPADPGCDRAADDLELDACVPGLDVSPHPGGTVTGTTVGLPSPGYLAAPCATDTGVTPEQVFAFTLTRDLTVARFSTIGSSLDTVLYLRRDDCSVAGDAAWCNDDSGGTGSLVSVYAPAIGTWYAVVDAGSGATGTFQLSITGEIAGGDPCDPADTSFVCTAGYSCDAATSTCVPTQCNDDADNDGDTLIDELDPGCSSVADDDETDPAVLPQCGDGTDNDGDGLVDYPADPGCDRAADDMEQDCLDSDPIIDVTYSGGTYPGTTAGAAHDSIPSCGSSSNTAPDVVHSFRVPGTTTVTIDVCGASWDTTLYLKTDCSAADFACNDDGCTTGLSSILSAQTLAAGTYFIYVDGFSSSSGDYTLHISGTVADGQPCDPAQVVTGFLQCSAGRSCIDDGAGGFACL